MMLRNYFPALLLAFPLVTLPLTAAPSVLMSSTETRQDAHGRTVFTGQARAVFNGAKAMTISAGSITHDRDQHSFLCQGGVAVECGGQTITAAELTVDLGSSEANIYLINPAGVIQAGDKPAASPGAAEHLRRATPFSMPAEGRAAQK